MLSLIHNFGLKTQVVHAKMITLLAHMVKNNIIMNMPCMHSYTHAFLDNYFYILLRHYNIISLFYTLSIANFLGHLALALFLSAVPHSIGHLV